MWSERREMFWKHICRIRIIGLIMAASCVFLAGCGENDREEQTAGQQEEQEEETWEPMTVSDTEKKEAETSVKEAAEAYEGIYPYKENGKAISEKDRKQVIKAMGEKKIAAVDADGTSAMENSRKAENFYEAWEQGKTSDVTIIRVSPSGGFSSIRLQSENGAVTGILATAVWDSDGSVSVSELVKYKVKRLEMTEDNKLICEFYLSDQAELQSDGTMEFQL